MNDRDIIQRKQAEEALRESEHRFRDYAETAFDWFWEMGPDFQFTNLSHQAPFRSSVIGATRWDVAADVDEELEISNPTGKGGRPPTASKAHGQAASPMPQCDANWSRQGWC